MKRERKPNMADLLAVFKKVDRNRDGFITTDELTRLLTRFCHLMLVTTEESVSAVRRRADQHNKNIAREQSSTAAVKKDNEDDLTEEREPQEKEEESISEKLEEAEDEVEGDQQEVDDPFVSQPKPSVVYEPPLSETSPGSQSSLEQITTLSITNSPSLSPISFEDNETRQPSSLEHNEPDNLANERGELSSQKDDAILPSLFSHSNDSMKKNEEERDEAIDEQTDHLNQEQTSSETGSKTILTGPIPKPPQDVEQWNSISGKGCFFLDVPDRSDPVISCHHFALTLPERSSVWMESLPGNMSVDAERGASDAVTKARHMSGVMLKVRHMREQELRE